MLDVFRSFDFGIEQLQTAASKDVSTGLASMHVRLKYCSSLFDTIIRMSVLIIQEKSFLMMMIMITSDQEKI